MSTTVLEHDSELSLLPDLANMPLPEWSRQYSAEELLQFPSDWNYELVEGYLRPLMMPTGDEHGLRTGIFTILAGAYILTNDLGDCFAAETGFLLSENPATVKAPDFAFVSKARRVPLTGRHVKVVPDLVLETRSPNDRKAGIEEKVSEWLSFGTRYVLDLDPVKQTILVYCPGVDPLLLSQSDSFTAEDILPGFALPLTKVFP